MSCDQSEISEANELQDSFFTKAILKYMAYEPYFSYFMSVFMDVRPKDISKGSRYQFSLQIMHLTNFTIFHAFFIQPGAHDIRKTATQHRCTVSSQNHPALSFLSCIISQTNIGKTSFASQAEAAIYLYCPEIADFTFHPESL
jgi:hypothetical protein